MIGKRFGNYQVLSLLGEGGMGAVYLAEHPEIGRKVAIKVLHGEFNKDSQLLGRFLNEARAANAIRHPNLIEILDSGTTSDGIPYLVMEYLEGEPLSARIRRHSGVPLRDLFEFAYQAASALSAAHRKGIVHRDLKPDNLFVVPDMTEPGREHIKVLDFGIAKLQTQGKGDSVRTRTGMMMGTPVYMSPEQCLGTKELDLRSDIYSLGCILFEMALGRPPFFSEGFGELVNMHLNQPPPSPRALNPAVTEPFEQLILKCLAKRPEQRFASMAELMAMLKHVAGAGLIKAGSSSPDASRETLMATPTPVGGANMPRATEPFTRTPPGTLSDGTGEARTIPRKRRSAVIWVGGAAAALAVVSVVALSGKKPTESPAATVLSSAAVTPAPKAVVPPPRKMVRLTLTTSPAGATVKNTDTGASLGLTPLRRDMATAETPVNLSIGKEGFETASLSLVLDRDREETISLEPTLAPRTKKPGKDRPHPGKTNPREKPRTADPGAVEEPAKL